MATVDERQRIAGQGFHHQFDADEPEHDGQAHRKIHQLVKQFAQQEVQLLQAQQGEHIRGEHDERILGQAENRRNRIEREHDIGGADGQEHNEHRRPEPLPVLDRPQLLSIVFVSDVHHFAQRTDKTVFVIFFIVVMAGDQFERGDNQERAEQEEHPSEPLDDRRANQDEDATQHQRDRDAHAEHVFLQLFRYGEIRHDDDEYEEIVNAQRIFSHPARIKFDGRFRPGDRPDDTAENQRRNYKERDMLHAFLGRWHVWLAPDDEKVNDDEYSENREGRDHECYRCFCHVPQHRKSV